MFYISSSDTTSSSSGSIRGKMFDVIFSPTRKRFQHNYKSLEAGNGNFCGKLDLITG